MGRQSTAFHEAAHFVIAERFGHYCGVVSIEPKELYLAGFAATEAEWGHAQRDREVALVYLAGLAGERLVRPDANEHGGASDDYQQARRILGPDVSIAEAEVAELVAKHQHAIRVLAEVLLVEKTLAEEEADLVVSAADEGEDHWGLLRRYWEMSGCKTPRDELLKQKSGTTFRE